MDGVRCVENWLNVAVIGKCGMEIHFKVALSYVLMAIMMVVVVIGCGERIKRRVGKGGDWGQGVVGRGGLGSGERKRMVGWLVDS